LFTESKKTQLIMSQELRNKVGGERDISRTANEYCPQKNYEGFEGMNYEQVRQPYNPNYTRRSRSKDERKDSKRPDEG
jgi:hypothetical protein